MSKPTVVAVALAASAASHSFTAVADAEIDKLREEMRALREEYQNRIESLERRLSEAERAATRAEQAGKESPADAAPKEAESARAGGRARGSVTFNPEIGLVLQGTYFRSSQDPVNYGITGFIPPGNGLRPGVRGFSLAESELSIGATVDPYFRGYAVVALTPDNQAEIEEAYVQTLALPQGLGVKAGRFFSDLGYQNLFHQHAWDFVDAPLVYQAFWGNNLAVDGVQLRWVAPTATFVEFGGELGQGKNLPGEDFREKNDPGAGTLFMHVGGDFGRDSSYRFGISGHQTKNTGTDGLSLNTTDPAGNAVRDVFSGRTRIAGADFVYKWAPSRNPTQRNFKLQGEWYTRWLDGQLTYDADNATGAGGVPGTLKRRQSGWYAQAVYQFIPRWRAGLRYDRLDNGSVDLGEPLVGLVATPSFRPSRWSTMVDWSGSEFSRLRLQYSRAQVLEGITDDQFFVQYIMSLGAHGAHQF